MRESRHPPPSRPPLAPARRHRGCRARIRPPNRRGRRRASSPEALPDFKQAAPQPRLDCVDRLVELGRQLLPAPATIIGEQHKALPLRLKLAHAYEQPFELLAAL